MNTAQLDELMQLSVPERIQLAEDLWDSIASHPGALELSDAQVQELDSRLENHRQNPAVGSSWDEVRARLKNPA